MMRTVSQNYMLERERDAAKRNYDGTLKIYRESQAMMEAYPTSEYLARQDRDEAQATLERLNHELREAENKFDARNIARYLEHLVPAAATNKPSVALQEELAQNKRQIDAMNAQIKSLETRLADAGNDMKKAEAETKKADITARSAMSQIDRQRNRVDEINSETRDLTTRVAKVEEGQQRVAHERVDEINSGVSDLATRVAKVEEGQQTQETKSQLVNEKLSAAETTLNELVVHRHRVDKDLKLMNDNMEGFDADIFKLSEDLDTIKSAATGSQPQSRPSNPDAMDIDTALTSTPRRAPRPLNEKAEAARKELKVSPAVFEALGEIPAKLIGLQTMKEYLAEAQGEALDQLAAEIDKLRDDIMPKIDSISGREKDLKNKYAKLQTDHESLYKQTAALAALPQPTATISAQKESSPSSVQQGLSFAAIEDLSKKIDEVDTKYGILHRGLDTRMQNTHTDALAHQILGSLQAAYPNLTNTDEAIRQMTAGRIALEKQMEGLTKTMEKVRAVVNAQGSEVQAGKKGRVEMEQLARGLTERVEELARIVESIDRKAGGGGGGGADQRLVDELRRKVEGVMEGTLAGGQRMVFQAQLEPIKVEIKGLHTDLDVVRQTAEKAVQRVKLDVNDKLRAFDIQLQEFREKITLEGDESMKDQFQTLTYYTKGLHDDLNRFKEKYITPLGKRSASQATSPNDSDAPMSGNGERRKRKKKKRVVEDADGEDS